MRRIRDGRRIKKVGVKKYIKRQKSRPNRPNLPSKLITINYEGKRIKKKASKLYEKVVRSRVNQFKSDYKRQRRYRGIPSKKIQNTNSIPVIPGLVLIIIGIFIFLFPDIYKTLSERKKPTNTPTIITPSITKTPTQTDENPIKIDPNLLIKQEIRQQPMRIIAPRVSIDVSIKEASVVNGYWEVSDTTASHGVGSASPGENGNIVIFAHARDKLFLPLRDMKSNDTVYVLTKDRWYRYEVQSIKMVEPTDIQTIAPSSNEVLTLYTCSGFLDNKRMIVTALPLPP